MATVYCDWTSGNDGTGNGSAGNPYKTIDQASTGLSGGDEVRVAKSPAHTALSETLSWTDNSTSVGTTGDLTGELAAGDMIGKDADDGMWYEISSLNATTITLRYKYSGTTETVTSYKMGFHDYGSPATASTSIQAISASGTSESSLLTISGGWNLTTEEQDGWSFFCVTHASNRYGYGLYSGISGRSYVECEKIVLARCYYGIRHNGGDFAHYADCGAYGCANMGVYMIQNESVYTRVKCAANSSSSLFFGSGNGCVYDDVVAASSTAATSSPGISIQGLSCIVKKATCRNNTNYGLQTYFDNLIGELVLSNNNYGLYVFSGYGTGHLRVGKITASGNTNAVHVRAASISIGNFIPNGNTVDIAFNSTYHNGSGAPYAYVQRWNDTEGDSRMFFAEGIVYRDTADARSGACLKATPDDATAYMWITLGKHRVTATGSDITLSVYAKDDAGFNGDVGLMALMNGQVTVEWTAKTMATSYGEHTLTVSSASLVANEWIELFARVRGTAGSVFFDDFSAA